ncbi:glycosyltransferase [Pseudoalteromonas sp. 1181_04]
MFEYNKRILMQKKPLITIYMATFNRVELLKRAVNSVLSQTYSNFELIVVDDCSSDETIEYLVAISEADPRIRFYQNEKNSGACASRNKAIAEANGVFITGLDDDDEFMPLHIESLLAAFDEKYAFVACSLLENTGSCVIEHALDCGIISLDSLLHYNKVGNQVFTLTSRLQRINGFDESFPAFQDYDTWTRLVYEFGQCKKIKQATYVWHTGHEQERISNNNNNRLIALDLFINKHKRYMSKKHNQSMFIMKKKLEKGPFNFIDLILNVNKLNFKTALATYININFYTLGARWRRYKRK